MIREMFYFYVQFYFEISLQFVIRSKNHPTLKLEFHSLPVSIWNRIVYDIIKFKKSNIQGRQHFGRLCALQIYKSNDNINEILDFDNIHIPNNIKISVNNCHCDVKTTLIALTLQAIHLSGLQP